MPGSPPQLLWEAAKLAASERVTNPGLRDLLRQWWEDKYHLPSNHELFQDATELELLIGFWEDYYRKHSLEAKKAKSGEVVFKTGDPLIDKWEEEIAQGLVPDLFEGLPPAHRRKWEQEQQQKSCAVARAREAQVDLEGFSETY